VIAVASQNAAIDSPRAYLIVLAAFIGAFVSFGVVYTFGVFLRPMAMEFHTTHAVMSTLFSTVSALSFFLAPFTGELTDHYGARRLAGRCRHSRHGALCACSALNVVHSIVTVR
jgi:MFS family permease